ncbi:lipid IV(A) 3-deoxy-D-manno-octulosonic acid transferase [Atopomonas sediminilitoris]|uniref:lipid IV(A) 3-deoxy-D-manno-octulosonic acid transferase n=1 Tax=Atopomonas sediminilitoris TaxID=2919919 RepID=UPI001F4EDF7B|nr:lipid IV(A) 3-deoxy-D-manno-octulosonic acid transferase [Atopomonas sediminilitoris]MCJ8170293.1 lipid IV(A) 3-deoxy-D-manno-octulosonic acid transferase [Atopomonas sediminilitoris]
MNRSLYTLLFCLLLPLILLRLAWRAWRAPAYARRIAERFACYRQPLRQGGIWLHAVSVGESIAAAPLVRELAARYPDWPITITCMTPTGSERIQALFMQGALAERVQHVYLPYDLPWLARRFLARVQPKLAIIMETELWPNHIAACAAHGVPVVLANARLSARSARGYAKLSGLTAPMLAQLSAIAVQTQAEAERFLQLGARAETVQVTGSIKFDIRVDDSVLAVAERWREDWHLQARPVWVAASTHAGEDELMLAAHRQLLAHYPDALLILVPRHPERFASAYQRSVEAGWVTERRSTGAPVVAATQVFVGDSMGELMPLMAMAQQVFVGGSLVVHGGHNLLEPAALGLPVLSGPHVFNFLEIATLLRDAGGLTTVQDADSLACALIAGCAQPTQAQAQGQCALAAVKANQGALSRLLALLDATLPA